MIFIINNELFKRDVFLSPTLLVKIITIAGKASID